MRTTIQISDTLRRELKILASKRDISYQKLLEDMIEVFKELDRERTIVSIPTSLAERMRGQAKKCGFKSISEYTSYLLRTLIYESNAKIKEADAAIVKDKLRKLGYIS